eukprot:1180284-Lingulodinium_polyedra.AAC.1
MDGARRQQRRTWANKTTCANVRTMRATAQTNATCHPTQKGVNNGVRCETTIHGYLEDWLSQA